MSNKNVWWKVFLDIVILLIVAFPLLVFMLWVEPFKRGFFLDDNSLKLPYKNEMISTNLLIGVGFAFIICTVILVELIRDKRGSGIGKKTVSGASIAGWVWQIYITIGVFTFGAACQQFITMLTKYTLGRLRPHFFDLCVPDYNYSTPLNLNGYIEDYTCTGIATDSQLKDMKLSFLSGHASFAMYAAVFFILYIQVQGKWRGSKLLRHGFQFAAFIVAWYVGLSRITDHMHHWGDVTAGFINGAVVALLTFYFVLTPKKLNLSSTWHEPSVPDNILPRPVLAPSIR